MWSRLVQWTDVIDLDIFALSRHFDSFAYLQVCIEVQKHTIITGLVRGLYIAFPSLHCSAIRT
jgi:hypothetical protein